MESKEGFNKFEYYFYRVVAWMTFLILIAKGLRDDFHKWFQ